MPWEEGTVRLCLQQGTNSSTGISPWLAEPSCPSFPPARTPPGEDIWVCSISGLLLAWQQQQKHQVN